MVMLVLVLAVLVVLVEVLMLDEVLGRLKSSEKTSSEATGMAHRETPEMRTILSVSENLENALEGRDRAARRGKRTDRPLVAKVVKEND